MKDHIHLLLAPKNIQEYSKIILLIKRTRYLAKTFLETYNSR